MATNQRYNHGDQFDILASDVTAPGSPESDSAVLVGADLPGVALTDVYEDGSGDDRITVKTNGVYDLDVEAASGAISVGDIVYIDNSSGALSNTNTDVRYGYALGAVDNAATSNIPVKIGY